MSEGVLAPKEFHGVNRLLRMLPLVAILGAIILFPGLVEGFRTARFTHAIIFGIIGLSLNILMGYAGQISLGHQAFVGIGAFTAAFMATNAGVPFALAVPIAGVIGAATAAVLGIVALRIQGLYLALITLAYGSVAERSIFSIEALTGGGAGLPAPRPGIFQGDKPYAYLCLVVLGVLLFIDWRMLKSKFGRGILALKSNEQVASSFGVNPIFYKVGAFVVAGAYAGIGGGLLAFKEEHVVSQDFTFTTALTFVIMVVVGGLGSRLGVLIGSAFTAYFPFLIDSLSESLQRPWILVLKIPIQSFLLLITITQFPGGIAQQIHPLTEWLSGKPFPKHHKQPKEVETADATS
jgi:branched-chain amino acid transport system permease protein